MELIAKDAKLEKKTDEQILEELFDELISTGKMTREVKVGKLTFIIKPLSTAEVLDAETVYIASLSSVPPDVISRVRTVSTLSHAIISVNGREVPNDDKDKARDMQSKLRELLLKLPPSVLDTIILKYRELVDDQTKVYEDLAENTENF
jgi:hypothetical protein